MRPLSLAVITVGLAAPRPAAGQIAALVSQNTGGAAANSHSHSPAISHDGRFVAFESLASNLTAGVDATNGGVFVRDVFARTTMLASTSTSGAVPDGRSYRPAISGDGRIVVFWSQASNLVGGDTNGDEDLFAYDRVTGTVTRVNLSTD